MTLVDQPGSKGVGSELRTTDEDIMFDSSLSVVELLLDRTFRSICVLRVDIVSNVLEYTILLAACQTSAKSRLSGDSAARLGSVSHTIMVSYIRRP